VIQRKKERNKRVTSLPEQVTPVCPHKFLLVSQFKVPLFVRPFQKAISASVDSWTTHSTLSKSLVGAQEEKSMTGQNWLVPRSSRRLSPMVLKKVGIVPVKRLSSNLLFIHDWQNQNQIRRKKRNCLKKEKWRKEDEYKILSEVSCWNSLGIIPSSSFS